MKLRLSCVALAGMLGISLATPAGANLTPELLLALQGGGYIVYMRHGPTDKSERPKEEALLRMGEFRLDDCATQRNLTDSGRARLRDAGAAFRLLNIPVGRAVASRYCRTLETARLFLGGEPTPANDLTPDATSGEPGRADALAAYMLEPPAPGTNTVIVAHGGIMAALKGIQPDEGEALIYEPGSQPESQRLVGKIKLWEWVALASPPPD